MENNENKKNIEIQNERETRRKEKIILNLVTFFIIGAILGLLIYAMYKIENAVYMIPIFTFVLAIIISTII